MAVIPVILFHAGIQGFSGGFAGVDVFFVISGYLITTIILAELDSGGFSIVGFYERRARRILPALFVVMLACLPFAWIWLIPPDMKSFSQSLVAVSAFASNILFWRTSGYFDTAAELKPLLHTWSLAVEEQYYVLFPAFLVIAWRFGRRSVVGLLSVVFVVSLAAAQWGAAEWPTATFYLLPTRGWELLLGAFVAFWFASDSYRELPKAISELAGVAGLALILLSVFLFDDRTPFPSFYALVPTVGTAMIIMYASADTFIGRMLASRILVGIGLISYSAYLWHQPLFAFARHRSFEDTSPVLLGALAMVSLGLAYLTWRFVEKPFRDRTRFNRGQIFGVALVGTVAFASFGLSGHLTNGFSGRAMAKAFEVFAVDTSDHGYIKCNGAGLLVGSDLDYCVMTSRGEVNAVLIGDSHADDKFYGIEKNAEVRNWGLIGHASCPPVLGVLVEGDREGCQERFEKIIDWIVLNKSIDTVVLSFFGNYALTTPYAADHVRRHIGPDTVRITSDEVDFTDRFELFYYGLFRTTEKLLKANKRVIVLIDIPELPFFPLDCVKGRSNCAVSEEEMLDRQGEQRKMLSRLKSDLPMVRIYDPVGIFCDSGICGYRSDEIVLYRDSHHLTLAGSDFYGKRFAYWLTEEAYLSER